MNELKNINLNNRADQFLLNPSLLATTKTEKKTPPTKTERFITTALPFFSLHAKTSLVAHLGASAYQAYHLKNKPIKESTPAFVYLASTTVLAVFAPRFKAIVTLTTHIYQFTQHAWNLDGQSCKTDALQITYQVVYIASIFYATPGLLALSLVTQGVYELYQANEFREDRRYWEAGAYAIIGVIRGYQAIPHVQAVYFDQFGAELDQARWEDIYDKEIANRTSKDPVDFKSLLAKHGVAGNNIEYIDFGETSELNNILFNKMQFRHCDFSRTRFTRSTFDNVTMTHCKGTWPLWMGTTFNKTKFKDCNFENLHIFDGNFNNSTIVDCDFSRLYLLNVFFNNSKIKDSDFDTLKDDICWIRVTFNKTRIVDNEFRDSRWLGITFNDSRIIGNDFTNSRFEDLSFNDTTLKGDLTFDFENTKWENTDFNNTTFKRISLKNAHFLNSKQTCLTFDSCKLSNATFETQTIEARSPDSSHKVITVEMFVSENPEFDARNMTIVDCQLKDAKIVHTTRFS